MMPALAWSEKSYTKEFEMQYTNEDNELVVSKFRVTISFKNGHGTVEFPAKTVIRNSYDGPASLVSYPGIGCKGKVKAGETISITYEWLSDSGPIGKAGKKHNLFIQYGYAITSDNTIDIVTKPGEPLPVATFSYQVPEINDWDKKPLVYFPVSFNSRTAWGDWNHDGPGIMDNGIAFEVVHDDSLGGDDDDHAGPIAAALISLLSFLLSLLGAGIGAGAGGVPPLPPFPSKFVCPNYPELGNRYVRQDEDGDIWVKDPVTGKETLYKNNGDGTYRNFETKQDWTPEEIGERLRERSENSDTLRRDYIQGKVNEQEQRDQWAKQNQRDRERGYSDEMKAYRDWKAAEELKQKKQEELERLAKKYHVAATEKAVKDAIKWEQIMNEIDSRTYTAEAEAWDKKVTYLETTEKVADFSVNVLAAVTPGGSHVKNAFTFAKSTLVGVSEAVADGKSGWEAVGHVTVRMGEGALCVIQNEAGKLSGGWKGEYGITVGTEFLKSGLKGYHDSGGDWGKALKAGLGGVGTSTTSFVIGKGISAGFTTLKEGSADYMKYAENGLVPKGDAGYKIMSTVNKVLNGDVKLKVGPKVNTYNLNIRGGDAKGAKEVYSIFERKMVKDATNTLVTLDKGRGFAFINATINKGDLAEAVVNETLGAVKYGEGDDAKNIFELTGGQYGEEVYNFGEELSKLPKTAARYAVRSHK